jgi:hypothetical protein
MYLSPMLALHVAVCDRWSRQYDHQGRNAQNEKKTVVRIIVNSESVKSELARFHCNICKVSKSYYGRSVLKLKYAYMFSLFFFRKRENCSSYRVMREVEAVCSLFVSLELLMQGSCSLWNNHTYRVKLPDDTSGYFTSYEVDFRCYIKQSLCTRSTIAINNDAVI